MNITPLRVYLESSGVYRLQYYDGTNNIAHDEFITFINKTNINFYLTDGGIISFPLVWKYINDYVVLNYYNIDILGQRVLKNAYTAEYEPTT